MSFRKQTYCPFPMYTNLFEVSLCAETSIFTVTTGTGTGTTTTLRG